MVQKRQQTDEEAAELVESPQSHLGDCIWGGSLGKAAGPRRSPPACEESSFSGYMTKGNHYGSAVKNCAC